jgi:hypothetical protein
MTKEGQRQDKTRIYVPVGSKTPNAALAAIAASTAFPPAYTYMQNRSVQARQGRDKDNNVDNANVIVDDENNTKNDNDNDKTFRISIAICVAIGCDVAAIPLAA